MTASNAATPSSIDEVLAHNRRVVENAEIDGSAMAGRPIKHLAVISCMDTRLTRMLPHALGLADGDAVIIKAAGATIVDPYGEVMRSVLVAVGELGVNEIMVVGHTNCGTHGMRAASLLEALRKSGIAQERVDEALATDPRAATVLNGFSRLETEVAASVEKIRTHPLVPPSVSVRGFVINIETGALTEVAG